MRIKFVPSSTNKNLPAKTESKNIPEKSPKPQIQILKNPNNINKSDKTSVTITSDSKFQTITQLNEPKTSNSNIDKAMSPPKSNKSLSNYNYTNNQTNNQNFNNGNNISNNSNKNSWNNSPNNRQNTYNLNNSNSNQKNNQKSNVSSSFETYHRNLTPSNIGTGTGVPNSTMEQSPAPGLVPIPFGSFTPTFTDSNIITNNQKDMNTSLPIHIESKSKTRNALLNSIFSSAEANQSIQKQLDFSEKLNRDKESAINDPLSMFIQNMGKGQNLQTVENLPGMDSQFKKLNKITKLREILRSDIQIINYIENRGNNFKSLNHNDLPNKEQDIIEHFKQVSEKNEIKLSYVQFLMPEGFYGEIYLENFRLIKEQDKKRKRCSYFAHRNALLLLYGHSELAVRISPQVKRDQNITLDKHKESGFNNNEIEFEYELYLVDSIDFHVNKEKNENDIQAINGISLYDLEDNQLESMKPIHSLPIELTDQNLNPATDKESIFHLNTMLKSLILPQKTVTPTVTPITQGLSSTLNQTAETSNIIEEDENDEDDNDLTMNFDRKTRIKESIGGNFCLFIPDTMLNITTGEIDSITDRNSIQILNNSCQKSGFNMEFELKLKSSSNKQLISADQVESDSGDSESENIKRKYKCKCLINRIKIASSHAKTKIDSKRQAALKSLNYLAKIFPIIKETSYSSIPEPNIDNYYQPNSEFHQLETSQSLPVQSTTENLQQNSQPRYFKITKDDLFKGLVPPTLFETSNSTLNTDSIQSTMINSKIGTI
jgi:hypothetical protein